MAIPRLQIRSNLLIAYNHNDRTAPRLKLLQSRLYQQMREVATYSGIMTVGAKKRLTRCIELLIMSTKATLAYNPVKGKYYPLGLVFLTLTVSETTRNLSGREAHAKLLEPMLQWMRRKHGVTSYIWKAELQKRGQIHYHITFDKFIHWREVRTKWNELQRKAGLLETYHAKFHEKNKYKKTYRPYDPPSVEIKGVKKNGSLSGYLIKEIAKSFQNEKTIDGKVWDCSLNLKQEKYYTVEFCAAIEKRIQEMVDNDQAIFIQNDHCRIWRVMKDKSPSEVLRGWDTVNYIKYLENIKNVETVKRKPPATKPIATPIVTPETVKPRSDSQHTQQQFNFKYGFSNLFSSS